MLGRDRVRDELEALSRDYNIASEDFLKRMLEGKGSDDSLASVLGARLSPEKLEEALAAAREAGGNARDSERLAALEPAPRAKGTNKLRDSLRRHLAGEVTAPDPRVVAPPAKEVRQPVGHLEPLRGDSLLAGSDAKAEELTIFDVVHRRYVSVSRSQGLVTGRLP